MKKYRVTFDDQRNSKIIPVEVEVDSLSEALFRAGVLAGRRSETPFDELVLLRIEEAAGWLEMRLP